MSRLTNKEDSDLRSAFDALDQANAAARVAKDTIHELVTKQVAFHGASAVVMWLKERRPRPQPWDGPYKEKDAFLMEVLRILPSRSVRKSLLEVCKND